MSRWLSSVNSLLEKLDGQVGDQIAASHVRTHSEEYDDDDSYYEEEEEIENEAVAPSVENDAGNLKSEDAESEEEVDFDAFDEEENDNNEIIESTADRSAEARAIQGPFTGSSVTDQANQIEVHAEKAAVSTTTPRSIPDQSKFIPAEPIGSTSRISSKSGYEIESTVTNMIPLSTSDPTLSAPSAIVNAPGSIESSSSASDDDQTSMNNADTTTTTTSSAVMVDHPAEASWTTNDDDGGNETNPENNDQSSSTSSSGSTDESVSGSDNNVKDGENENVDIKFTEEEIVDAPSIPGQEDQKESARTNSRGNDGANEIHDDSIKREEIQNLQAQLEELTSRHKDQVMALQDIIQGLEKELTEEKQTSESELTKVNASWKQKMSKLKKNHKTTVDELTHDLQEATDEMTAQAAELERAGLRMERDRLRHKEELEKKDTEHTAMIKTLQEEHEVALQGLRDTHSEQLADLQSRLKEVEEARLQEGGNYEGELHAALEREQKTMAQVQHLHDEKSTLTSQVSSLQSQLTSLEHKCANLSSTLELSQQRERDAEDRLDAALTTQTRQLQQRQSREKELEKTVAELGAALVVAKQRETARLVMGTSSSSLTEKGESSNERAGEVALSMKVTALEEELQMVNAQFELEQQHSATLKEELESVAKERSEDAVNALAKQRQHDRQVAQLESQIANLNEQVRDLNSQSAATPRSTVSSFNSEGDFNDNTNVEQQQQLVDRLQQKAATLSAQVVRQQERMDTLGSENVALKSRLKVALSRAEQAESSLAEAAANFGGVNPMTSPSSAQLGVDLGNAEVGGKSANPRFAPRLRRRGRTGAAAGNVSIRAALNLTRGETGDLKETVGQVVDAMDKLSVETGAMLSVNPLARAFFLLYFVVLHVWTFVLLFFHAHYDNMHVSSSTSGLTQFASSNQHPGGHHLFLPATAAGGLRGGTSP